MDGTLSDLIKASEPLSERVIGYISHEILRGLRCIHRQHRIHRDIKSGNILIDKQGAVKLGDFGLAAQLTQEVDYRMSVVGTSMWMAPELITGSGYDSLADIWSFGILLL